MTKNTHSTTDKPLSSGQALARRWNGARERFLEYAAKQGLTRLQSEFVLNKYVDAKLLTLGVHDGQFHAKHGALLDKSQLHHVASQLGAR